LTTAAENSLESPASSPRWVAPVEVLLLFAIFAGYGAWPVPDVNETHYLVKAKHYWQNDWCGNDFFCTSADAHAVFYWSFGWLTKFFPLATVAWIGRIVTWGLLAWAWRRLSVAVVPRPWMAVLSGGLFVALAVRMHMAGEWIVGGVEAKGFAYVLVLLAIEAVARGRWNRAWLLAGAAGAFHPLAGGWTVFAAGVGWLAAGPGRPSLRSMLPALAGGLLLSLPGLVPVLLINNGADADLVNEANAIYVFKRLRHHLILSKFELPFVLRHLLLIALWLGLMSVVPLNDRLKRLRGVVLGGISLAAIGWLIDVVALQMLDDEYLAARLLRYYWYRTTDIFVPLGVACWMAAWIDVLVKRRSSWALWLVAATLIYAGGSLALEIVERGIAPLPRSQKPPKSLDAAQQQAWFDDWLEVCRWARENTPADSVFLTPRLAQSFRWYAGRSQVVSHKDIPQDARGIVEWRDRIDAIYGYDRVNDEGEPVRGIVGSLADRERIDAELEPTEEQKQAMPYLISDERLLGAARKYDADYIVIQAERELPLERVFANENFAVYRIGRPGTSP